MNIIKRDIYYCSKSTKEHRVNETIMIERVWRNKTGITTIEVYSHSMGKTYTFTETQFNEYFSFTKMILIP